MFPLYISMNVKKVNLGFGDFFLVFKSSLRWCAKRPKEQARSELCKYVEKSKKVSPPTFQWIQFKQFRTMVSFRTVSKPFLFFYFLKTLLF